MKIINLGFPQLGEVLCCPVCGKEFKVTDDTKYAVAEGFTCSWKCCIDHRKAMSETKQEVRRGRKRKKTGE